MGFCSTGLLQSHHEVREAGGITKASERTPTPACCPPPTPPNKGPSCGPVSSFPMSPAPPTPEFEPTFSERRLAKLSLCGMKPSVVDFAVLNYSWM